MRIAICGGGTGGHIYPLLALREELGSRDVETVLYLSEKGKFVTQELDTEVKLFDLEGYKRSLSPANLRAAWKFFRAYRASRREMRTSRPDVAVGFGGYASLPAMGAARSLGIPTCIHEQNLVPGTANRLLAHLVDEIALTFAETAAYLGRARAHQVITGNPLRNTFQVSVDRAEALAHFELETERKTIAVLGGSQGAEALNHAVREALPAFAARADLQMVHGVGAGKYKDFIAGLAPAYGDFIYRPFPFIQRMDLLYGLADLAVCRSGATTLAELQVSGVPSILVPYPYATAGHQEENARWMEREGASRMVFQEKLAGDSLYGLATGLLADERALEDMSEKARGVSRPDASSRLADLVMSLAGKGGRQ